MVNISHHRRKTISDFILSRGEVKLAEIAKLMPDVSEMTLRRDLEQLEKEGHIVRTYGGARSITDITLSAEDVYSKRAIENVEAKSKIALKTVELLKEGRSIYLDSGSTMMCLARIIPDLKLYICTSDPNIALELAKKQNPVITLIGGQLNRDNLSLSGSNSIEFIKNINIDMAFLVPSAFSIESGFTNGNYNEFDLKKAIVQKARQKILLMDMSKAGHNMPHTFATLEEIDILITDSEVDNNLKALFTKNNVTVI